MTLQKPPRDTVVGTDPIIAVQDMRKNIANLYWRLKEDQPRLGQDLITAWQKWSEIVYEI